MALLSDVRGAPRAYVVDEAHELLEQANRLKYIDVVSDWLSQYLT